MIIDCETCEVRGKDCDDCVVTFLTIPVRDREAGRVQMDDAQTSAVQAMAGGGLVPPLRLVRDGESSKAS